MSETGRTKTVVTVISRIADRPTTQSTYVNYGGDKAWPWPQDDWPLLIGRHYPPMSLVVVAALTPVRAGGVPAT